MPYFALDSAVRSKLRAGHDFNGRLRKTGRGMEVDSGLVNEIIARWQGGEPLLPMPKESIVFLEQRLKGPVERVPFWRTSKITEESGGKADPQVIWEAVKEGRLTRGIVQNITGHREVLVREDIAKRMAQLAKAGKPYATENVRGVTTIKVNRKSVKCWGLKHIESKGGPKYWTLFRAVDTGRLEDGVHINHNHSQSTYVIEAPVAKRLIAAYKRTGKASFRRINDGIVPVEVPGQGRVVCLTQSAAAKRVGMSYNTFKKNMRVALKDGRIPKSMVHNHPFNARGDVRVIEEALVNVMEERKALGKRPIPTKRRQLSEASTSY